MRKQGKSFKYKGDPDAPRMIARSRSSISKNVKQKLGFIAWTGLAKVRMGRGDHDAFDSIAAALNTAAVIIRDKDIGAEHRDIIIASLEAIKALKYNGLERGKWLVTGDQAKAIGAGLELYDALVESVTEHTMLWAIETVLREATSRCRLTGTAELVTGKKIETVGELSDS